MYYPHVLDLYQRVPLVRLAPIRCFVRADSGIREGGDNRPFRDGKNVWNIITPISTLAVMRLAVVRPGATHNIAFHLPKHADGSLIYPPSPFHSEIEQNPIAPFRERIVIVEYAAYVSHIRIVVESLDTEFLFGTPVGGF